MSDLVHPPTFYTQVKTPLYFSKVSLAIGLPASRNVAQARRSDSVTVYWTCMNRLPKLNSAEKSDTENFEIVTLALLRRCLA